MIKHFTGFKYKGRSYMLTGSTFSKLPGFRWNPAGCKCTAIAININLSEREKQSELHKLITGRGLRAITRKAKIECSRAIS